jgi:hypothetical protein
MFRRITIIMVAAIGLVSTPVFAHEGHDEENVSLTENRVAQIASRTLSALVKSKKVGAEWAGAQRESIATRTASGKAIWVAAYKNPDGKVDNGKPLYLIFDDLGNFAEMNHTGKLKTE